MRTIGIVTFHRANNYGVLLQAYATESFLNANGYDAEIIDYTNAYEQRIQRLSYKENGKFTGYITSFIKNVLLGKKHFANKAFGSAEKIFSLSQKKYTSKDQMDNLEYDVLVAGSDQVWNSEITNGIDEVFLLNFGKAGKRISIASSMGSTVLSLNDQATVKKNIARFDAISVREQFAKEQLALLTDKSIKVLMDPTFLLDKAEWLERLGKKSKYAHVKEKYILTYLIAPNKNEYRSRVAEFSKKLQLPVWTIQFSNYTWKESSKKILGATLEDFIALISNAELVLTDSFHGTVFSINLQTNFIAFKHKYNPVRVVSLLEKLNLMDRLDMSAENYSVTDFTESVPLVEKMRTDSREWILNALE